MRIWEIEFWNGDKQIVFANTRRDIRKNFIGIVSIHEIIIL